MPPNPQTQAPSPDIASATTPRSHIYKSTQSIRQIQFPGRKRVVKTYSRRGPARSPIQRTLIEIGNVARTTHRKEENIRESQSGQIATDLVTGGKEGLKDCKHDMALKHGHKQPHTTSRTPLRNIGDSSVELLVDSAREGYLYHDRNAGTGSVTAIMPKSQSVKLRQTEAVDDIEKGKFQGSLPLGSPSFIPQTPMKQKIQEPGDISITSPLTVRFEIPSSQPSPFTPIPSPNCHQSSLGKFLLSPLQNKSEMFVEPRGVAARGELFDPTAPSFHSLQYRNQCLDPVMNNNGSDCCASFFGSPHPAEIGELLGRQILDVHACSSQISLDTVGRNNVDSKGILRQKSGAADEVPDTDEEEEFYDPNPLSSSKIYTPLVTSWSTGRTPNNAADISSRIRPEMSTASPLVMEHGTSKRPGSPQESQQIFRISTRISHVGIRTHATSLDPEAQIHFHTQQSQVLESQRVPLEAIHGLGPQTDRSDVIISVRPEQAQKIIDGTMDHEFRNYKIPQTVTRFWLYVSQPACELRYMAVIGGGFRQPGEIDSNSGYGNGDFNTRRMTSNFAYKLEEVYQLNNPVSLEMMKNSGWVDGPPERYTYVPPAVVGALLANLRCRLLKASEETSLASWETSLNPNMTKVPRNESEEINENCGTRLSQAAIARNLAEQGAMDISEQGLAGAMGKVSGSENSLSLSRRKASAINLERFGSRKSDGSNFTRRMDITKTHQPLLWLQKLQQQHTHPQPLLQSSLSADSTQIILPDSLYEEVRQAPPVVILDSEDDLEE